MLNYKLKGLCAELNKILNRDGSTEITKSITALYVTRLHPHYAKELINLNKNLIIKYFWGGKFIGLVMALAVISGKLVYVLLKSATNKYKIKVINDRSVDYLIISHLVSVEHGRNREDFYFGNIEQELLEKNKKVIKLLLNHTTVDDKYISLIEGNSVKLILPNYLGLKLELTILMRLFEELISFISYMKSSNNTNTSVLGYITKSIVSRSTQKNLRLFYFLKHTFKTIEIRNILFTFEGFAWERLATKFANMNHSVSIGYIHSAVFKDTVAIKNTLKGGYDPNYLVLAGGGINKILMTEDVFDVSRISILGTSRKLFNSNQGERDHVCLVIPEGILDECETLFAFSRKCAQIIPNIRFIWRLHPVIKEEALERYGKIVEKIPNITISDRNIEKDIEVSKWALYRGSTAIIAAVSGGVIPVYLEKHNDINIDPLYIMNKNKTSDNNIYGFLDYISNLNIDIEVKKYANKYYSELNIETINNKIYDKRTIYF